MAWSLYPRTITRATKGHKYFPERILHSPPRLSLPDLVGGWPLTPAESPILNVACYFYLRITTTAIKRTTKGRKLCPEHISETSESTFILLGQLSWFEIQRPHESVLPFGEVQYLKHDLIFLIFRILLKPSTHWVMIMPPSSLHHVSECKAGWDIF